MTIKRVAATSMLAGAVVAAVLASPWDHKQNVTLSPAVGTGINSIGLPYMGPLATAENLFDDIEAAGGVNTVLSVSRWDQTTDSLSSYNGFQPGTNFSLDLSQGYLVQVNTSITYLVQGTHDPGLTINLTTTGTGINSWSYNYNSTLNDAAGLIAEIEGVAPGSVVQVARWNVALDSLEPYTGKFGFENNFALEVNRGYFIQVNQAVNWIPSHF